MVIASVVSSTFPVILIICLGTSASRTGRILPDEPRAFEDGTFVLKVEGVDAPFKSCLVSMVNSMVRYSVNEVMSYKDVTYFSNATAGECGVIISPVKIMHKGQWTITVVDAKGHQQEFKRGLSVYSSPEPPSHHHIKVTVGTPLNHRCYEGIDSHQVVWTRVYNPGKELVIEEPGKGDIKLDSVTFKDNGTWQCVLQVRGSWRELTEQIHVDVLPVAPGLLVTNTATHTTLLCSGKSIKMCAFERPDGEWLSPVEGVPWERYMYHGHGIRSGHCGLAIQKPLEASEVGLWKCVLSKSQGFFGYVNDSDAAGRSGPVHHAITVSAVQPLVTSLHGRTVQFLCKARTTIMNCHAVTPLGRTVKGEPGLGECVVSSRAYKNETGTWTCFMGVRGSQSGNEDLKVPVQVTVYESELVAKEDLVKSQPGEAVTIGCRSYKEYKLDYCRIVHPSGVAFNMGGETSTLKTRFSYAGKGLDRGECLISINPIEEKDFGVWACGASLGPRLPPPGFVNITLTR